MRTIIRQTVIIVCEGLAFALAIIAAFKLPSQVAVGYSVTAIAFAVCAAMWRLRP